MSVQSFDPNQLQQSLDKKLVDALITLLGDAAADKAVALSSDEAARFTSLATHAGWSDQAKKLADEDIISLIRLFTLGEALYSGWQAGEKSPVVPLVRELKSRDNFPLALSRWIKTNSNNKFLPHGSLMDRL